LTFALATAVLYLSFAHDALAVLADNSEGTIYANFQHRRDAYIGYDSNFVLDRIRQADDGRTRAWAPLGTYYSQFGLQGVALAAVRQWGQWELIGFAYVAARVFALLTAMTLAAFFTAVALQLGRLSAGVGVLLTALSPIPIKFAPSLFWATFLLFAPFVATWCLWPWLTRRRGGSAAFYAILFGLVLLKALCGYEYITTVILSPLAALGFHRVRAGTFSWRFVGSVGAVCATGVAAFATAVALHAAQLNALPNVRDMHPDGGWGIILQRAKTRTVSDTEYEIVHRDISNKPVMGLSPEASYKVRCFLHYFKMPAFATSHAFPATRKVVKLYWVLWAAGALAVAAAVWPGRSPTFRALGLASAVGLAASLSWHVAAVNHMCIHQHLNQIIFHIPFLPLAYVAAGYVLGRVLARVRLERPCAAAVMPAAVAVVLVALVTGRGASAIHEAHEKASWPAVFAHLANGTPANGGRLHGGIDMNLYFDRYWSDELLKSSLVGPAGAARGAVLLRGWAVDAAAKRRKRPWLDAPRPHVTLVVVQGGHVVPSRSTFFPRSDVETRLRTSGAKAGFELLILAHYLDGERPIRVFAVSGTGPVPGPRAPAPRAAARPITRVGGWSDPTRDFKPGVARRGRCASGGRAAAPRRRRGGAGADESLAAAARRPGGRGPRLPAVVGRPRRAGRRPASDPVRPSGLNGVRMCGEAGGDGRLPGRHVPPGRLARGYGTRIRIAEEPTSRRPGTGRC
jgi:hypothetical protein